MYSRAEQKPRLSGTWQGVLKAQGFTLRRILKVRSTPTGDLTATMYSPDEMDIPVSVNTIDVHGNDVVMHIDVDKGDWSDYHRVYTAKLSSDGNALHGTWVGPQAPAVSMDFRRATPATTWAFPSAPTIRYVTVGTGIKIETFDWGGSGRPLVFLPGLGSTADIFQKCAHVLAAKYHVYGINPPAFGASDKPAPTNAYYSADNLGDDVVEALNELHVEKPVLLGHSIAGEELSDIGTRYPRRAAALIYLDAAYSYAFYTPAAGAWTRSLLDASDLRQKMLELESGNFSKKIEAAESSDLARIREDLRLQQATIQALPPQPAGPNPQNDPAAAYYDAILAGEQKFIAPIPLPILAIVASPMKTQNFRQDRSPKTIAAIATIEEDKNRHIAAFAKAQPTARIVKIPNADHFVFISNQAQTLRAITEFVDNLPSVK